MSSSSASASAEPLTSAPRWQARVELLPASGHPHLDDPDAVARVVVPFLREQVGGR